MSGTVRLTAIRTADGIVLGTPPRRLERTALLEADGALLLWEVAGADADAGAAALADPEALADAGALPAAIVWDARRAAAWAWEVYGREVTAVLLGAAGSERRADGEAAEPPAPAEKPGGSVPSSASAPSGAFAASGPSASRGSSGVSGHPVPPASADSPASFRAAPGPSAEAARLAARAAWARAWWPASALAAIPPLDPRLLALEEGTALADVAHLLDDGEAGERALAAALVAAERLAAAPMADEGVANGAGEADRGDAPDRSGSAGPGAEAPRAVERGADRAQHRPGAEAVSRADRVEADRVESADAGAGEDASDAEDHVVAAAADPVSALRTAVAELVAHVRETADDLGIRAGEARTEADAADALASAGRGGYALAAGGAQATSPDGPADGSGSGVVAASGTAGLDLAALAPGAVDPAAEARWRIVRDGAGTTLRVSVDRAPAHPADSVAARPLEAVFAGVRLRLAPGRSVFEGSAPVPATILLTRPERRTLEVRSPGYRPSNELGGVGGGEAPGGSAASRDAQAGDAAGMSGRGAPPVDADALVDAARRLLARARLLDVAPGEPAPLLAETDAALRA